MKVLLVDDQAVVRAGLRTILSTDLDITVVGEADNGRDALSAVRDHDPDVVLMDLRMPVMDGITATRRLVSAGARCRVCVLTTYGTEENVYDALVAGAAGFCAKTDPPERIIAAVRAVADGDYALGSETTALIVEQLRAAPRPTPGPDPLAPLTPREREVFALVADGLSNQEVAERLFLGEGTVKTHVARVLAKLGLRDRVQLVVFAHRSGAV